MEILLGETTLSTPDHYSSPDLPVYGSPVYCESDALDRSITKAAGLNIVHVACSPSLPPHVQGPVFLQEPPSWLEFSNTTGAMLSCSAHGSPPPDIRWMDAADKELPHIPRLRFLVSGNTTTNADEPSPYCRTTLTKSSSHSLSQVINTTTNADEPSSYCRTTSTKSSSHSLSQVGINPHIWWHGLMRHSSDRMECW
uniref:Ig-like domain-containing protein n=1 Tax=Timema shepardi TaxID=629360 RepID=A0A7R9AP96_TIMSH|nr:unnamed protein product [Timema shepardi]